MWHKKLQTAITILIHKVPYFPGVQDRNFCDTFQNCPLNNKVMAAPTLANDMEGEACENEFAKAVTNQLHSWRIFINYY
jgi:hypothetical protein